ncbi:MAG TPA: Fic family protein, partial [Chitinophagaceae bacterium]|nr:Fic family protein [Chitinophagaceae bacterium]
LHPLESSKEIADGLHPAASYATIKRIIQQLVESGLVVTVGRGKSSRYQLSPGYELFHPVDMDEYYKKEIDDRVIKEKFNRELLTVILPSVPLFTQEEMKALQLLQEKYRQKVSALSSGAWQKEMERLAIDLSWKSSQIEGNTYSLLETERLLKYKQTAAGKTKDEAVMLLNHKEALDFIINHPDYVKPLSVSVIEDIHSILIKDLAVDRNIRTHSVGISGTNYTPLDNEYQIREALEDMCLLVNKEDHVPAKALLSLLLLSYIQPFADGNKRTARIISNALLMCCGYCPLSFRTVGPVEYKKAMLLFYEQNNLSAFKKIFMEQFAFAVGKYF